MKTTLKMGSSLFIKVLTGLTVSCSLDTIEIALLKLTLR